MRVNKFIFSGYIVVAVAAFLLLSQLTQGTREVSPPRWWKVQAIDTMKYSRDLSKEALHDPSFAQVIEQQVGNIARTGASHVAIGTPYNQVFLPVLQQWVAAARRHKLKVWFRGNWAGWEQWFDYPPIGRDEHLTHTKEFILTHADLFADGDIFTACPECENGGPGDPRRTGDVKGFRDFFLAEYQVTQEAFKTIGKQVASNYNSMNGDVARLIMDREMTQAMGGIVVIDHYVATAEKLAADIKELSLKSGGKIVLGEIGVPIPDIHGDMDEAGQAAWLDGSLRALVDLPEVIGLNYWVNVGGSTQLWTVEGRERQAVAILPKYFLPPVAQFILTNEINRSVPQARIYAYGREIAATFKNSYMLTYVDGTDRLTIVADGYLDQDLTIQEAQNKQKIVLVKTHPDLIYRLFRFIAMAGTW